MSVPKEHQYYLHQFGFVPNNPAAFNDEERTILARYGRWMEALASGVIAPATPEQEHFLQSVNGKANPVSRFEEIWLKVKRYQNGVDPVAASPISQQAESVSGGQMDLPKLQAMLRQLGEAKRELNAIYELIESKKQAILKAVQADLAEVDALYAGKFEEAKQIVSEIEAEVKDEVLRVGVSVRGADVHAIYSRPRVTWDSESLRLYAETHPEVANFRKIGKPSVSLRYHR